MTELYNVLIDEKQVIGVGPLLEKHPADTVEATLYRKALFYFEVYTRNYAITVGTDWLSFMPGLGDESVKEYEKIKQAWEKLWSDLQVAGMVL